MYLTSYTCNMHAESLILVAYIKVYRSAGVKYSWNVAD